jgi:putative DNA primase/helicase
VEIFDFVAKLDSPQHLPSGVAARCPAHDDQVRSLMVNEGANGGIVVKCHAGCHVDDITRAMGLMVGDLMGLPALVESYPYTTEDGRLLWTVERWSNPKTFRCVPNLPAPAERVLYQMPAIDWARREGRTVFVVEGERDVHTLRDLMVPATCNVGGAGKGKWLPQYNEMLKGLNVVVIGDNDLTGKLHARDIGASLKGWANSVTLMHSPYGSDVSDLIHAGYSLDSLALLPDDDGVGVFLASSVPPKPVVWAWHHYFPAGKLSIIEGDPGDGKSVLTIDLAARWSTGAPMPDGSNGVGPWHVALISAEDDPEDTLRPRLERAGADLDRVHLVTHGATPEVPFDLVTDLPWLAKYTADHKIKAIFIDPLSAFMPERTDTHNDSSTRRALMPLKVLAQFTGAAIVVVRHLVKSGAGKAIYRGGGSIAFVGAARAAFLVTKKHGDPDIRLFACVKSNLARTPPTLTYRLEVKDEQPYLVWGEAIAVDAQTALDGPERDDGREDEVASQRRVRQYEREFLMDTLADGPLAWAEIKLAGKDAGFSEIGLRRARADLGLIKVFGTDGNRTATWAKPAVTEGDGGSSLAPVAQPNPSQPDTKMAEQEEQVPNRDDSLYPDGTTEEVRDAWLDEMPKRCDVCKTEEKVNRYYKPWWVTRCVPHNPISYGDTLV